VLKDIFSAEQSIHACWKWHFYYSLFYQALFLFKVWRVETAGIYLKVLHALKAENPLGLRVNVVIAGR